MVHLSSLLLQSLKSQLNVNSAVHLHVTKFVALHLMYMDSNFDWNLVVAESRILKHIILWNSDFTIPRFWTVAYGKHSLTYLGPVIQSKLDKFTRSFESLDIINFLKVRQNSFSQPCWSVLVKTFFMLQIRSDSNTWLTVCFMHFSVPAHLHTSYRFNINFVSYKYCS